MMLTKPRRSHKGLLVAVGLAFLAAAASSAAADQPVGAAAAEAADACAAVSPLEAVLTLPEAQIWARTNQARSAAGLPPFTLTERLLHVARSHSAQMAQQQCLFHRDGNDVGPGDRLSAAQIPWTRYGENVARARQSATTAQAIVAAWLASPAHAHQMLSAHMTDCAVAVALDAEGNYYVTQLMVSCDPIVPVAAQGDTVAEEE